MRKQPDTGPQPPSASSTQNDKDGIAQSNRIAKEDMTLRNKKSSEQTRNKVSVTMDGQKTRTDQSHAKHSLTPLLNITIITLTHYRHLYCN